MKSEKSKENRIGRAIDKWLNGSIVVGIIIIGILACVYFAMPDRPTTEAATLPSDSVEPFVPAAEDEKPTESKAPLSISFKSDKCEVQYVFVDSLHIIGYVKHPVKMRIDRFVHETNKRRINNLIDKIKSNAAELPKFENTEKYVDIEIQEYGETKSYTKIPYYPDNITWEEYEDLTSNNVFFGLLNAMNDYNTSLGLMQF